MEGASAAADPTARDCTHDRGGGLRSFGVRGRALFPRCRERWVELDDHQLVGVSGEFVDDEKFVWSAGSSSVSGSDTARLLEFAQCMRSHGVPNFPDPTSSNGKTQILPGPSSGIDSDSPTLRAALQTCQKYVPGGNLTPAESAQDEAKLLKYAECMRSHGVTNFPAPSSRPDGGWSFDLGWAVNQNSPTYQSANQACKSLEP